MFTISCLTERDHDNYTRFLLKNDKSLFYLSVKYKKLLERLLECESRYLVAKDKNGSIVGAFPLMISKKGKFGRIVNSLPYYGSNGGIIPEESLPQPVQTDIKLKLLQEAENYLALWDCGALTIITSPFETDFDFYENNVPHDYQDKRIGQITILPETGDALDQRLLSIFQDPRPRNIRKALKSGITCRCSLNQDDMDFLYTTHRDNIVSIEGLPKDQSFFSLVSGIFHDNQYRVYIAEKDGERIAALLLFYFNNTVEYFTPAVFDKARTFQPTALIIFEAMKDAIDKGYKYWNWGGTWWSQTGVYDFKKRWGAVDYPYNYFVKVYDTQILRSHRDELLNEYPGFYVIPFDQLKGS